MIPFGALSITATGKLSPLQGQAQAMLSSGPPHGAKGLIAYPVSLSWLWTLISILLLSLLVFLLFKFGKKYFPAASAARPVPEDPIPVLLRKLQEVQPGRPFDRHAAADFYYSLGLSFRNLLEYCCDFPATDMTRQELRNPVQGINWLSMKEKTTILEFLNRSDLIKFSEAETSADEALNHKQQLLGISEKLISSFRSQTAENTATQSISPESTEHTAAISSKKEAGEP
ncbi:MAG: hypothetical protein H6618_02855 [Deltaproteobacteria bacterium]|nr:hypothetical protein [Deltaproteobacteria bacterium]